MAKGNVKKGFAIYLMILLFMVIGAFLICVSIMLLSPSKVILGVQFFKQEETNYVFNVSEKADTEEKLDFTSLKAINFDGQDANITIIRSNKESNVHFAISANIKGFAKANQNTKFSYDVSYIDENNDAINVKFTEPEGFLFLKKEINCTLVIPSTHSGSLENTSINIKTNSGKVALGNSNDFETGESGIKLQELYVQTNSGSLVLNEKLDGNMTNFYFKTTKGRFDSNVDITASNKLGINASDSKIRLKNISSAYGTILDLNNSNAQVDTVSGTGNIELYLKNGQFNANLIDGELSSFDNLKQMNEAKINIEEVKGNISLPYINKSTIKIGKTDPYKQVYIKATSGKIVIEELNSRSWIETESGDMQIGSKASRVELRTTTGTINFNYDQDSLTTDSNFYATTGKINIRVWGSLSYMFDAYRTNGNRRNAKDIYVENFDKNIELPLQVNNGGHTFKVVSDGKINITIKK